MADAKINGLWVSSFAHVASISWSTRFGDGPCGPDLATIEVDIDPRNDAEQLFMGRTVEIYDRGLLVFGGPLTGSSNGSPRVVEAKGWARRDWDATITHAPGEKIGRTPAGAEVTPVADTEPRWLLDARDLDIGVADDRLFTRVIAEYVSAQDAEGNPTATSTVAVDDLEAQGLFGVLPFALDLTPLGLMGSGAAVAWAEQQLREFVIPEWTERVTTTSDRLLTTAGHYSHPPDVKAGQMVRIYNMPTSFGGLRRAAATDVVLGEVAYSTQRPSEVTVSPARVAVRSLADVVREIAETRKAAA